MNESRLGPDVTEVERLRRCQMFEAITHQGLHQQLLHRVLLFWLGEHASDGGQQY